MSKKLKARAAGGGRVGFLVDMRPVQVKLGSYHRAVMLELQEDYACSASDLVRELLELEHARHAIAEHRLGLWRPGCKKYPSAKAR